MASDRGVERDHGGWIVVGWVLVEALVRPVVVEVLGELVEDGTVTSWRRIRISMSLAAALRASNSSQPNTVTAIRYSSRNSTARDHVMDDHRDATKHQVTTRMMSFGTVQR